MADDELRQAVELALVGGGVLCDVAAHVGEGLPDGLGLALGLGRLRGRLLGRRLRRGLPGRCGGRRLGPRGRLDDLGAAALRDEEGREDGAGDHDAEDEKSLCRAGGGGVGAVVRGGVGVCGGQCVGEGGAEEGGGLEALVGRAGECRADDAIDGGGHVGVELAGRGEGADGQAACEDLVEDDAEGVDVGAVVDAGGVLALLGRHVVSAAHGRVRDGQLARDRGRAADDACDAEVGELGRARRVEQDVGRLEVAVDDVVLVGVLEGRADAVHQLQGVLGRQGAVAAQVVAQAAALDELHDEVVGVALDALVEDAHDVRV